MKYMKFCILSILLIFSVSFASAVSITNDHGQGQGTTGANSNYRGQGIYVNNTFMLLNVTVATGTTATHVRLYDSSLNVLTTVGITNLVASGFNYTLTAGNIYWLASDGSLQYDNGFTSNVTQSLVTWIAVDNYNNGVIDVENRIMNIKSVTGNISDLTVNLTNPVNNAIYTGVSGKTFNSTAAPILSSIGAVNATLILSSSNGTLLETDFTNVVTNNKSNFTMPSYGDGTFKWNIKMGSTLGGIYTTSNSTYTIDSTNPIITSLLPSNNTYAYSTNGTYLSFSLNATTNDTNLASCWYNSTFSSSPTVVTCNANTLVNLTNIFGPQVIYYYANDTTGHLSYASTNVNLVQTSFPVTTISGSLVNITTNISTFYPLTSIILNYNNTNSTPSVVQDAAGNYIVTATITAPSVTTSTNISFFYYVTANTFFTTATYNQTVSSVTLNTGCGGGTFLFTNITNYDEENLTQITGTVEYTLLLMNNNILIGTANGTLSGQNVQICSSTNLSASGATYSLQLRYYGSATNTTGYMYETYNIQNSATSTTPINVPLYFERNTTGTEFVINYIDFNYLTHPGAIIQVQRQYLSTNTYNVVEIPLIGNNGLAQAAFNANNVRYKIIVVQNGQVIDTFNDVFPACQSIVLGQCQINLRGTQSTSTSSSSNFIYTLTNINNTLTLTYVIPNGVPESVNFITNQNSPFLTGISSCNTTVFGSGGTIVCTYNNTVGQSIVSTQINIDGVPSLFGSITVAQDMNNLFLGNNYFIAFVLMLTLVLIFVSSGPVILIIDVVGVLYLGLVFLIKGVSLGTVATSTGWLIVAVALTVYQINSHEEKYL